MMEKVKMDAAPGSGSHRSGYTEDETVTFLFSKLIFGELDVSELDIQITEEALA